MFDTLTDLTEKIYLGEHSTIELKRELPHRDSLGDEIAAFANGNGGVILIGVDDDSEIVGIHRQDLDRIEKTAVDVSLRNVDPAVHIFTEKLRFDDREFVKN